MPVGLGDQDKNMRINDRYIDRVVTTLASASVAAIIVAGAVFLGECVNNQGLENEMRKIKKRQPSVANTLEYKKLENQKSEHCCSTWLFVGGIAGLAGAANMVRKR